jgi:hypothetical protein
LEYFEYIYDAPTGSYRFNDPVFISLVQTAQALHQSGLLLDAGLGSDFVFFEPDWLLNIVQIWEPMRDYDEFTAVLTGNEYIPLPPIAHTTGMAVRLTDMFAVNANAPEKTAALEFMKILWSPELQNSNQRHSQSILAEVDEQHKRWATGTPPNVLITAEELEKYNHKRYAFFSNINRIWGTKNTTCIRDILEEHTTRFFLDEITLEEMIDDLRRKTDNFTP